MEKKSILNTISFIEDNIVDVLLDCNVPYLIPNVSVLDGTYGSSFFCTLNLPSNGYVYVHDLVLLEKALNYRFDSNFLLHIDFEVHAISFVLNITYQEIENKLL